VFDRFPGGAGLAQEAFSLVAERPWLLLPLLAW